MLSEGVIRVACLLAACFSHKLPSLLTPIQANMNAYVQLPASGSAFTDERALKLMRWLPLACSLQVVRRKTDRLSVSCALDIVCTRDMRLSCLFPCALGEQKTRYIVVLAVFAAPLLPCVGCVLVLRSDSAKIGLTLSDAQLVSFAPMLAAESWEQMAAAGAFAFVTTVIAALGAGGGAKLHVRPTYASSSLYLP